MAEGGDWGCALVCYQGSGQGCDWGAAGGVAGVCGLGCVAGVCDQGCGQGHTFYLEGFGNLGSTKIVNSRTFSENKVKLGNFFLGGG